MKLRPYQSEARDNVIRDFESEFKSALIVMATGTGKTQVFCDIIQRRLERPGAKKAMILVHRKELCWQAVKRLRSFGIEADVEMGDFRASKSMFNDPDVIVTSIQTQIAGRDERRMHRFNPSDFDTIICDEAHHSTSKSWKDVIGYYQGNPDTRVLGVTATPDRADEEALGQIFETVAFEYDILDAVKDGWLVPVHQQMVYCESLDFSQMRTTAGDLNGADLARVMETEENVHRIVSPSIEIIGDKRAIMFASSLHHAEMSVEIFNRHYAGMADWIHAKTPPEERDEKLKRFDDGFTQVMVNVGILTEGYDSPGVEVILQARPTKSRSLYSQMIGRGTRTLPGTVDGLDTSEKRIEAIKDSPKPRCLVVDFAGNSGRHKLISTMDVLGGKVSDDVIDQAESRAKKEGGAFDVTEMLEEEREKLIKEREAKKKRLALIKSRVVAKAKFTTKSINPFDVLDIEPERERGWDNAKQITTKQSEMLRKQGIDPTNMTYSESKQVIAEIFRRWNNKLCTLKQARVLKRYGFETKNMSMKQASSEMDKLAKNGWKQ